MTVAGVSIDLADLQGDILRAYGNAYAHTAYVFFRVDDPGAGRAWLRGLLPRVTTAEPWGAGKPPTTLNLAVTADGLRALGLPDAVLATFSHEFRAGMAARAATLGDAGPSEPANWEPELHGAGLHVLATVNALDDGALEREITRLRSDAASAGGVAVAYEQRTTAARLARALRLRRRLRAAGAGRRRRRGDRRVGGGVPEAKGAGGRSRPASSSSATRTRTRARPAHRRRAGPVRRNGTYMVLRKLGQDVVASATCCAMPSSRHGAATRSSGQGRRALGDGTPSSSPRADRRNTPAAKRQRLPLRGGTTRGRRCPLGRTSAAQTRATSRLRRRLPAPPPHHPPRDALRPPLLAEAAEDDGVERGLVFVASTRASPPVRGHRGRSKDGNEVRPRRRQRLPAGRSTGRAR